MFIRSLITVIILISTNTAFALKPVAAFKIKNTLGYVTSYELPDKDVEMNSMSSDFKYQDLTQKEMSGLKSLMAAKQEYGKMFGFNDWKSTDQKFLEKDGERMVLIQGHYKDSQKKTVNFIEVYWADKNKSGQYLITSDTILLKADSFSEYLK